MSVPEDYIGKGPGPDEDLDAWVTRLRQHAEDFAAAQASSTAGRRLVRESISGKITRRRLLIEAFAGGYQHGVLAGITASKTEIARLEAALEAARGDGGGS